MKKTWSIAGLSSTNRNAAWASTEMPLTGGRTVCRELPIARRTSLAKRYAFRSSLGLFRPTRAVCMPAARCQASQLAKGRIFTNALLPFLFVIGFLTCAGTASAQTPPDQVIAAPLGPSAVQITFYACLSSGEDNCNYGFSIYRNPPGFTKAPVAPGLPLGAGVYSGSSKSTWTDTTVKAGTTYTYEVCTGAKPDNTSSNCTATTPVTPKNSPPPPPPLPTVTLNASNPFLVQKKSGSLWDTTLSWTSTNATSLSLEPMNGSDTSLGAVPATGSRSVDIPGSPTTYVITATNVVGTATAEVTVGIPTSCPSFAPPQSLSVYPYTSAFKWTNPSTTPNNPYATCKTSPTDIVVYRLGDGDTGWEQVADLPANNGVLATRYQDPGPFQPHSVYVYLVCEGPGDTFKDNCAGGPTLIWGADPVVTAVPVSSTSVKLGIAVDEAANITAFSVTRVVDQYVQGQKLGNGLMGCPTVTIGPGGVAVPVHGPPPVTVYSWTEGSANQPSKDAIKKQSSWTMTSKSAPYIFQIPDDTTVKLGEQYTYWASVVWGSSSNGQDPLTQSSDGVTVMVSSLNGLVAQQATLVSGVAPLKLSGGTSGTSQSSMVAEPMASSASRTVTPAASSAMMAHPAGTATASGASQAATTAKPAGAAMVAPASSMIKPASPMVASASPMMSSTAAPTPLATAQSAAAASPTMAAMVRQAPLATSAAGTTAGPCPPPSGVTVTSMTASVARPSMLSGVAAGSPSLQLGTTGKLILPAGAQASREALPVRAVTPLPGAANVSAAIKQVQQNPHDAVALYALGKAYCASRLKDTGVSYMYMALLLANHVGNVSLASQIESSLAEQGVNTEQLSRVLK